MSNIKDTPPSSLTISNNVLEVMNIITKHDFIHIREISRLANVSPTTAGNILRELEENNILKKKVLGKNCFYSLNKNSRAKKLIALVENYKFLKSCPEDTEDILNNISGIKNLIECIITYRENNKISLLFITSLDIETIRSKLSSKQKIIVLTKENFRNNIDSEMIKSILKDYIIISGAEKFIDMVY